MRTLILLSTLFSLALTTSVLPPKKSLIDPDKPIYLGDVFWPPSMTFIAWLPSEQHDPTEWCYRALDVSPPKLFSLGGIDALQMHDYFYQNAYITREGKRFADCWITPESGRMGACEGVLDYDCEGGQKFTGPGTRRWSCWVVEGERNFTLAKMGKLEGEGTSQVVTETATQTHATAILGSAHSSSLMGAFTPGVTGG
ncbi:uncharacterized protein PAC_09067 [Phialocephala subalpina]|uniref:AA1-like domain-containing protein n=1 Tax=Phialocephala subalpina TaxID=576137 RepID=A0A1L7X2D0_9HELO|nr:uncharacterized protein PAC_09067 [Phialocephala subalpina]